MGARMNRLVTMIFVVLALINFSYALDVTHTISDYLVYDDYIDYDASQNIDTLLGSYTYTGTNWKGFRIRSNGRVSAHGSNAVLVTGPYNSMTPNPKWTILDVSGSNIQKIEVSAAEDNSMHENIAGNSWTGWQETNKGILPEAVNGKQFIKIRISLNTNGYVDQIRIKYNTTMKDHPRLIIDDVAQLRQRCSSGLAFQCQKLKEFADASSHYSEGEWQWGTSSRIYALQYVLSGDDVYKNKARDALNYALDHYSNGWSLLALGPMGEKLIMAYDWIYDGLTASERAEIESKIIRFEDYMNNDVYHHPEFNNHIYAEQSHVLLAGITLYGGPNNDKAKQYLDIGYDYLFNHNVPATNKLGQGMGGWHESLGYFSGEMGLPIANALDGMRTATDVNFFEYAQGIRKIPQWYLYSTVPYDKSIIHLADNGKLWWSRDLSSASPDGKGTRSYLMAYAKNFRILGYDDAAAYAQYLVDELIGELYQSDSQSLYRGGNVYDILWYEPNAEKKNILDEQLDGYSPILGEVIMREGNDADDVLAMFHCGDYYGGHQHADNGHFSIWYKGYLAIDSGYYDGWGSSHQMNYARRTIAHNTLTIYKPGETFPNTDKNDGGQDLDGDTGYYDIVQPGTENDACTLDFYNSTGFDYINSDFTRSYKENKVSMVTRQFVYFRPDKFIVFDRINATDAGYQKRYILHSQNDMTIDGNEITFAEGQGRLFSRTLLPADPLISKVGGPGQEFTVEGQNFPITDSGVWNNAEPYAGKYRAEIFPSVQNNFDNFLHVMQVADVGTADMADTELLESADAAGAMVGDKVAVFSKTGKTLNQIEYSINTPYQTTNLIVDLKPGYNYKIEDNGAELDLITANKEGLIYFKLSPGSHDVAVYQGSIRLCTDNPGASCISGSCTSDYDDCRFVLGYCGNALSCCTGACTEKKECIAYETEPCDGCYDNYEIKEIIQSWQSGAISIENLIDLIKTWKQGC